MSLIKRPHTAVVVVDIRTCKLAPESLGVVGVRAPWNDVSRLVPEVAVSSVTLLEIGEV
jgi:hypothetical protein